jgi:hypothetical protein
MMEMQGVMFVNAKQLGFHGNTAAAAAAKCTTLFVT